MVEPLKKGRPPFGHPALQQNQELRDDAYLVLRSLLVVVIGSKSDSAKQNAAERVHEFVVDNLISEEVLAMAKADVSFMCEVDKPNEEAKELLQWTNAKEN